MDNDYKETIEATEQQIVKLEKMIAVGRVNGFIDISKLTKEEWLILRSLAGLGCSDIATALGKTPPYFQGTPLSLWKQKVAHIIEIIDNSILRMGNYFEGGTVKEYEYLTGRKVMDVKDKTFLHPEHNFLFANLDGIILPASGDGYGVLECKSTVSYVYDEWVSKLPSYYFRQVMGELSVMSDLSCFKDVFDKKFPRCEYAEIAVLILDKREVQILRVTRDDVFIEKQNKELENWWNEYVVGNIPPPETAAEWAKTEPMEGSYQEASADGYKYYEELLKVQKDKKKNEAREDELKDELIKEIKDSETLIYNGETIATYKQQSRTTVDSKKLKSKEPETFEKYKKISTFRVLLPKIVDIVEY